MAKDPAFLFYPGDWLGGVIGFNRSHKGAYMDLLMAQFNQGRMEIEDIKDVLGSDFDLMWERKLKGKFKKDEKGLFYNERLDNEQQKRKKFSESRRKNLNKDYSDMNTHTVSRMEDVNEDVNENIVKVKNKIIVPILEEFLDHCKTTLQGKYEEYRFSLESKYDTWVSDGWKDGHGKKISNWKNKINNTIPFLKPILSHDKPKANSNRTNRETAIAAIKLNENEPGN